MAWGNKKKRELEYLQTGQAAALEVGDLGAREVYSADEDDFKASWELEDSQSEDSQSEDSDLENTDLETDDLEPDSLVPVRHP